MPIHLAPTCHKRRHILYLMSCSMHTRPHFSCAKLFAWVSTAYRFECHCDRARLQLGTVLRCMSNNCGMQRAAARTARHVRALRDPRNNPLPYYSVIPNLLLMFVITISYSVLQPVIVLAGLLTFGLNWFVYRYLTLYVFYPVHESGGFIVPVFRFCSTM